VEAFKAHPRADSNTDTGASPGRPAAVGHELTFVLQRHWSALGLAMSADNFTDAEAITTVHRVTSGNVRLVHRLFAQITRHERSSWSP
jgi:hypothetical protein